jgi:predicted regulator of Ras-like GTPase activity (Roadblock/LC7/MglB family)
MTIVVIETGNNYTEQISTFDIDAKGTEQEQVAQAIAAVTERGHRVMTNTNGGNCEYVTTSDDGDYIAITVYPAN